jgi:tRNA-splicing ligase RtcB
MPKKTRKRFTAQEKVAILRLQTTVEQFAAASPGSFDEPPRLERVAITPEFHKARGIPVGTVLATQGFVMPQAIGNDINCGMRLHLTSLQAESLAGLERLTSLSSYCFLERAAPLFPSLLRGG